MRISTVTFQQNALEQMQTLQSDLATTQNQLATGKRIQNAADDPAAMAQVNQLNVQLSASQQYVTNGNTATSNLQLEEQAMSPTRCRARGIWRFRPTTRPCPPRSARTSPRSCNSSCRISSPSATAPTATATTSSPASPAARSPSRRTAAR